MLIGVFLFFVLATGALAWLFLPDARAWARGFLRRWWSGGRAASGVAAEAGSRHWRSAGQLASAGSTGITGWLRVHGRWLLVALALLVGVPLASGLLRRWMPVDTYDHTATRDINDRVLASLEGEQLVAPPPLPPELFRAPELEQARPMIEFASREWALLDDAFRQRLLQVFKRMRDQHGYELVLLEGYRSPQRQAQLAAVGEQVTRAGAWESYHQYGLAADVAFMRGGRIVISERDDWAMRGYELYGELAAAAGLTWGGGWRSLRDYGHVELRRPGVLRTRSDNAAPAVAQVH